jgi:Fe-S oxidoreductase
LNEVNPKRIVTTCPHCLHTLKNEYPAFGGNYPVIHHTQLIQELMMEGKLKLQPIYESKTLTYHDPCYLGRQNNIVDEPRQLLSLEGINLVEMVRTKRQSFCCGAGGAQMWKEEEPGQHKISAVRYEEALNTGAETLTVSCPFCLIMLGDAANETESPMPVVDLAEVVLDRLENP